VGTSGPIQPTLPAVALVAKKMHIPVFNAESQAVKDGLALASFGVNYRTVGKNAAKLTASILQGKAISTLHPIYPSTQDHHGMVNQRLTAYYSQLS
jgi:putative ABC transport system substrate-binding protein